MADYDNKRSLPEYIKKSLDDGFTITHKGYVCIKRTPAPSEFPVVEAVILALEATFAFFFWAMHSRVKDYNMSHARGWNLDTCEYDGDCSHNPMMEGLIWTELTAKQATTLAVEFKQKKRDEQTRSKAKTKRTKKFHCKPCNRSFSRRDRLERHNGVPYHKNRLNGLRIPKTPQAKYKAKCVRTKQHYCALCNYPAPESWRLQRHYETDKHRFAVIDAQKAAAEAALSS